MPSYDPRPFITVNGVTWTDDTVNNVQITKGRTDINQQPRASYASLSIITPDSTGHPNFDIDDLVVVGVKDTSNADKVLFTGRISDINITIENHGEVGYLTNTQVTAVGTIGIVNRKSVGASGYPTVETDGLRVQRILSDALAFNYITYAGYYNNPAYNTVSVTQTWNNLDVGLANFDAGSFDIVPYTGGATTAYGLAAQVASSANGVIYETNDGQIGYSDSNSRASASTFYDLPANVILASGIRSSKQISDIANKITLIYGSNQSVTDSDTNSIAQYGELAAQVNTLLNDLSAANGFLDYYLNIKATSRFKFNELTVGLHLDNMTNTLRDNLLDIAIGTGIQTDDLPASVYPDGTFVGFVEGWTWQISRKEMFLNMNVSDILLSILAQQWQQVAASDAWNTISTTLEWQDARKVS
jgi:hypothetical protein